MGQKKEDPQARLLCQAILELKQTGRVSKDIVSRIATFDNPKFVHADDNLLLLSTLYADIPTLESLSPYLHEEQAEKLIDNAFNSYRLAGVIHRKNEDQLSSITKILFKAGISKKEIVVLLCPHTSGCVITQN